MSKPTVIGFPQSTFVWTTRAALGLAGVEYDFQPIAPPANHTPEYRARHPWGKVPAFEHDGLSLFETAAICEYIEHGLGGASLMPKGAAERARARQVVSICDCYFYPPAVVRYALQYIFPRGENGQPDRATIEGAVPDIEKALGVLSGLLGDSDWFAGDSVSLADLYVGPLFAVIGMFPEGKALAAKFPTLQAHFGRLMGIDAFRGAAPQG